jgi:hypothetical protein
MIGENFFVIGLVVCLAVAIAQPGEAHARLPASGETSSEPGKASR